MNAGGPLGADTRWDREVALAADVTVPVGRRLRVAPGARVASAGAKLIVEGELVVEGPGAAFHAEVLARARARVNARGAAFHAAFAASDFALAAFANCAFGASAGASYSGFSRGVLRDCRFTSAGTGLCAEDDARLALSGCVFERAETGVALTACARARLRACAFRCARNGLWLRDRALADCRGGRATGGEFGLRASHFSRLSARDVATEGQTHEGILVEEDARARLSGCVDASARGGPALLGRARAELDGLLARARSQP